MFFKVIAFFVLVYFVLLGVVDSSYIVLFFVCVCVFLLWFILGKFGVNVLIILIFDIEIELEWDFFLRGSFRRFKGIWN